MKIENQLSPEFNGWYLGKEKSSTFAKFGCYLFCWTYLFSLKEGRQVSPKEVDKIFSDAKVYSGDLIISERAAEALGIEYLGKETDINKDPGFPSIKRVDYSVKGGKQFHFVVREIFNGKKVILDPLGGIIRSINYYEKKVGDLEWKKGGFEYRKIKI